MEPNSRVEQHTQTSLLPRVVLKENLTWKREKRRNFDRDDDILYKDELVFFARIPLVPKTTAFWCVSWLGPDSPTALFVLFFQKRQRNGLADREGPIDGMVITRDGIMDVRVDVNPEYGACFLYFLPGSATKLMLSPLEIRYEIALDDDNLALQTWMELIIGDDLDRFFPIAILRACASALLTQDEDEFTSLKEAFAMEGIDSTPEGLECLIKTCDAFLQGSPRDWLSK